jgi:hypothetical protein
VRFGCVPVEDLDWFSIRIRGPFHFPHLVPCLKLISHASFFMNAHRPIGPARGLSKWHKGTDRLFILEIDLGDGTAGDARAFGMRGDDPDSNIQ